MARGSGLADEVTAGGGPGVGRVAGSSALGPARGSMLSTSPHLPGSQAGPRKQGPKGATRLPVASSHLAPDPGLPTLQAPFLCCDWNFYLWASALCFHANVRKEREGRARQRDLSLGRGRTQAALGLHTGAPHAEPVLRKPKPCGPGHEPSVDTTGLLLFCTVTLLTWPWIGPPNQSPLEVTIMFQAWEPGNSQ